MTDGSARPTFVTEQQAVIHALFVKHRSMSIVARMLDLSQIRVREALVQHERNTMRDAGIRPAPLREMLKGDVTTRHGVPRTEFGGRPSKHIQLERPVAQPWTTGPKAPQFARPLPTQAARRLIVTSIEGDARVHGGFWDNLKAYAASVGAELVVIRVGSTAKLSDLGGDYRRMIFDVPIDVAGLVEVAADARIPGRLLRPLDAVRHRASSRWTVFPHPVVQLETLPRMRADGLKVHLTTGAMTIPGHGSPPARRELGAVIVEVSHKGQAFCRHLLSPIDGDGSFHDLDCKVVRGAVYRGRRVEALTFGDIHHAHIDPAVAAATWGIGAPPHETSLVDILRPRYMIFHDVCDFDARNHHDARDHLKRFAQMAAGGGNVEAEMSAAAGFLAETRRAWSKSVVVGSNHDHAFLRWLREADFRDDPLNAVFFLQSSLSLHRRLAAGRTADGFFEHTLRKLSGDGLSGVRFLQTGESLRIAGVEAAIHGHQGADGRQGDVRFFERMSIRATLGHTHRPLVRDGICCAGTCQMDLAYARGPITNWAVGHVVTYPNGTRQVLLFDGRAFRS